MKANIVRSGSSETWLKTEYFCPKCGSENVWVNEAELLGREDEFYFCLRCGFMFAMPVGGEVSEGETELLALLRKLREATNFRA